MSDEPRTPDDETALPAGADEMESAVSESTETDAGTDSGTDSGIDSSEESAAEQSASEDVPPDTTFVSPTPLATPVAAAPPKPTKPPKPTRPPASKAPTPGAVRKVELTLSRVDPLSVMKMSFLLSVAVGIVIVVATAVLWSVVDSMQVFAKIDDFIQTVMEGSSQRVDVLQYVAFNRVISLATLIAVIDVFILTALGTIFAFLYNLVAALVGGIHVTLTDD